MSMTMTPSPRRRRPQGARVEYGLYFVLLFPFVLAGNLIKRLIPRALTHQYADDIRTSQNVFNETAASMNSILPWIYMGR